MKHIWHERRHGQGAYCDVCQQERTPANDFADDCPGARVTPSINKHGPDEPGKPCLCTACRQRRADKAAAAKPAPAPEMFPGDRKEWPVFTGLLMYFPDAC